MNTLKIVNISLYKLRNEVHFGLMRFVKDLLDDSPDVVRTAVAPVLQPFMAAVSEEDAALELIRKSGFTGRLVKLDRLRVGLHNAVRIAVHAFRNSLDTQKTDDAAQLEIILGRYGSIAKATRYERTQLLFNLIQDLKAGQPQIDRLGLAPLLASLESCNNAYYETAGQRADEEAEKALIAKMSAVRAQLDLLYAQMAALVTAAMIASNATPFDTFVARLNARIDEVRRTARHARNAAPAGGGDADSEIEIDETETGK